MKQKILLSAYSCEPNRGSESEVGWNWAIHLSKIGYQVYVITRSNQKENIDKYLSYNEAYDLKFVYFDFPQWFRFIFKNKFFIYLYFLLWQIGIYFKVSKLLKENKFKFIHHVTFVSLRIPSFLCLYEVPFIFGPVSGGDIVPTQLRKSFSIYNRLKELIRDFHNYYVRFSPLLNLTFRNSKKIYVNSIETKELIPKKYHKKIEIVLGIGHNIENKKIKTIKTDRPFKLLFAGNYINIKGVNIILKVYEILYHKNFNFSLTMIGDGIEKQKHIKYIIKKNISDKIFFHNAIKREFFLKELDKYDLLLNPALRDSGSMITLEAMSIGLPIVSLEIGGPGIVMNNECGILISPKNYSEDEISDLIASKIIDLAKNPLAYKIKSEKCISRVQDFNWFNKCKTVYKD